ncbi:hypothetical protein PROFUN_07019 [Planoprotostelium fungivorum]|uniref:Uncharacterized protein n=1 Tax=Planoprotostelium fungivorum TaxID=1890364 RepID=A0A2P6NMT8_9EUKA|nr:hypothetical protein PROFUN_07019 [Planoprotostelium fungivorum]
MACQHRRHMITDLLLKKKFKYGIVFASAAFNDDYAWLDDTSVAAKETAGAFPPCFVVFDDVLGSNFATPWFVNLIAAKVAKITNIIFVL